MSIDEARQTCPVCNGTGDLPIRAAEELADLRRRLVLLEDKNEHMSTALIAMALSKAKPSERMAERFRQQAKACEPYWGITR